MKGKKIFSSNKAPKSKGPYSQAVMYGGILYVSGQIPVDPVSGLLVRATIEEETETVLNNIRGIVEDAGAQMEDVLKVTCFLADMNDFSLPERQGNRGIGEKG
jgi:2-iminobutanoate/2-iminopropanoate deaminase